MAGLSFVEVEDVTVDTPLLEPFLAWVTHLVQDKSPATVRSYVFDCRTLAGLLLTNRGKVAPPSAPCGPGPVAGVSEGVWADAVARISGLTLGDLHPKYLSETFAAFAGGHEPSTRRRAAAAWSTLCEYLTRRGFLASNPMRDSRIERGPKPAVSPSPFELTEADTLLRTLATSDTTLTSRKPWPLRDLALAAVLLTTGIRLAEACSVQVGDLRDRGTTPRLRVLGKGAKYRTIPLTVPTTELIGEYLAQRTERLRTPGSGERLFVQHDGRDFTARAMQHLVYRWYTRAGIAPQGRSCVHALRHTFATQAVNSAVSIVELQELLGHTSLETTRRYLRSVGQGLREAVEANPGARLVRTVQAERTVGALTGEMRTARM